MDSVFVGSDEVGYYREPNKNELRDEVERLEAINKRLREAFSVVRAEIMRGRSTCPYCEEGLQHRSECPFSVLSQTDE